jgi:hypothetical protein
MVEVLFVNIGVKSTSEDDGEHMVGDLTPGGDFCFFAGWSLLGPV